MVLAAGAGTRLRPLTNLLPKALCPVAGVPLVDLAIARGRGLTPHVAVNVHAGLETMLGHLAGRVHVSVERDMALGTAGALGYLRDWIDGRGALVLNADAWLPDTVDLRGFVTGWDRTSIRLLCVRDPGRADWGDRRYAGVALMPWTELRALPATPAGLYETSWRRHRPGDGLDLVDHDGPFFDCGTLAGYLAANLEVTGGESVIGPGARVDGELDRCVIWAGAVVRRAERLSRAIRAGETTTVLVR